MADFGILATATLLDSDNNPVPGAVVQYLQTAVNRGWSASALLYEPFNLDQDQFATLKIRLNDGQGGVITSPPMAFPVSSEESPRNSEGAADLRTIELEDLASLKMRTPNQNHPSFLATTSAILINTLGDSVSVAIADPPDVRWDCIGKSTSLELVRITSG